MTQTQSRNPADANIPMQEISVNLYRTDGAMVLVAPMPGVMPEDVEVTVDGPTISVRAELRTDAPKDYILHEWNYGAYERTVNIGEGYGGPVMATLGKGQLVVSVNASDQARSEALTVQPVDAMENAR